RLNPHEPGVWAPGKTNAVAEARQQATVNEQHIYLLDEIQTQQLQLIASLTNRVNRSAAIIRELESRQVELEAETRQWASIGGGAGGPGTSAAGVDQAAGTASGEEVDPASGEASDVEAVLARAFQGIQIDELFSIENPAFSGIIVWDYDNQSGVMQLSNLPSLPPDFRYQLWVLDPNFDNFVAGGTFDIPANVPQFEYTFRPGGDIREAVGYAVTAEDLAGTAVPRGPTVVSTRNLLGKL
ncbi:MAG: anti-sigma factor, partial [Verrucomicrobiota bacterium]